MTSRQGSTSQCVQSQCSWASSRVTSRQGSTSQCVKQYEQRTRRGGEGGDVNKYYCQGPRAPHICNIVCVCVCVCVCRTGYALSAIPQGPGPCQNCRDRLGDLEENWFILFSNQTLNTHRVDFVPLFVETVAPFLLYKDLQSLDTCCTSTNSGPEFPTSTIEVRHRHGHGASVRASGFLSGAGVTRARARGTPFSNLVTFTVRLRRTTFKSCYTL